MRRNVISNRESRNAISNRDSDTIFNCFSRTDIIFNFFSARQNLYLCFPAPTQFSALSSQHRIKFCPFCTALTLFTKFPGLFGWFLLKASGHSSYLCGSVGPDHFLLQCHQFSPAPIQISTRTDMNPHRYLSSLCSFFPHPL